jgi:hypothetical protein
MTGTAGRQAWRIMRPAWRNAVLLRPVCGDCSPSQPIGDFRIARFSNKTLPWLLAPHQLRWRHEPDDIAVVVNSTEQRLALKRRVATRLLLGLTVSATSSGGWLGGLVI